MEASVLRVLDLFYKVAIFELELRKCTSRTRLVNAKLRLSCWSCGSVLRALDLYNKGACRTDNLACCLLKTGVVRDMRKML